MTTILPQARGPWDVIGQSIGANLERSLPQAATQRSNRDALQKSLGSIAQLANNPNASPLDIITSAMQAGAGIPGSERYMSMVIPELLKFAESKRAEQVKGAGERVGQIPSSITQQPMGNAPQNVPANREGLPGFSPFFPTNVGVQGGPGNVPQAATEGKKIPLTSPQDRPAEIKRIMKEHREQGIPITRDKAAELFDEDQTAKKNYNAEVDKELSQRVKGQEVFGQKAVDYLSGVVPEDLRTPEMDAIFQAKGEEASTKGWSQAKINRYLANEAKNIGNTIDRIQKTLSRPTILNRVERGLDGTYRDFDQSTQDLRQDIKPLVDLGLYETARKLVQKLDYGPEEREMIVNPLSDRAISTFAQLPNKTTKVGGPAILGGFEEVQPDPQKLKEALVKVKQTDPNFSLLLARKMAEDKGYDWNTFKDVLNELEREGYKLENDQQNQTNFLKTPPLNRLEKLLHGLNLQGR